MKNYKLKLKESRKRKNITQVELAAAIDIDPTAISHYENGRMTPSLERLVQISQVLDVTLDELVEFKRIHDQYSDTLSKIE